MWNILFLFLTLYFATTGNELAIYCGIMIISLAILKGEKYEK